MQRQWAGLVSLCLIVGLQVACGRKASVTAARSNAAPGHVTHQSPAATGHQMRLVAAGPFTMGLTPAAEQTLLSAGVLSVPSPDAMPAHVVELDSFYIDQFQATVGDYVSYLNDLWFSITIVSNQALLSNVLMLADLGQIQANEDSVWVAVEQNEQLLQWVTWRGALAYCEWRQLRIPSEAQWEKTARGTDARLFVWGDVPTVNRTHEASPFDVYDMGDIAGEWVADGYAADFYTRSPTNNPIAPGTSDEVWVVRGAHQALAVRDSSRGANLDRGFRCAGSITDVLDPD
ncbi:MAG: SUMF1/EgtB/PvdO family nonheme iron enzyme [Gemmatimonadetes bacterium]|nr:SUMF1/EgtB/PvdO family nonheme iron enzyme [Gemmatimonadota bacterium]